MSAAIVRAVQLREIRRHDEAIAMLTQALATDPENPGLHQELALNRLEVPDQQKQGLEDIERAIGLDPDNPSHLTIKSHLLCRLNRGKEALEAAMRATALDPEDAYAWSARSMAHCDLEQWAKTEESARQALALDPDQPLASNLLAHSLRLQNRLAESEHESKRRLARDPENAFSFSTAGWSALQRNQPAEAEGHFREALRLEPDLEHARLGLREAYKSRSWIYRIYLRWVFFMQRVGGRHQWMVVIGLYLAYRFGVGVLRQVHPLLAIVLVLAYLLLVFGSWLASGIGNFLLLKDPVARLSLTRAEKCDALAVGGLFFGGLAVAIAGAFPLFPSTIALLGLALMGAAIPAGLVFNNSTPAGRLVFGTITIVIVACATAAQFHPAPAGSDAWFDPTGGNLQTAAIVSVFGATWIGLIPGLRSRD
ncbi:MAG: tetratricopeptide repeat protein [Akkermansiaceae bacterium]|nr:tetratricopeptide repeat protein [Akkermansiaceae bacterium]